MKRFATLVLLLAFAVPASAALRSPQVAVSGSALQTYFTGIGESIVVGSVQDATQVWQRTGSSTSGMTLMLQGSANSGSHTLGIYNPTLVSPALDAVCSGGSGLYSFSTVTFRPGNQIVVNCFSDMGALLANATYSNISSSSFGFYLTGPAGTVYTQDWRNPGGKAQCLVYAGTGENAGNWWLCFEETSIQGGGSDQDFDDEVVILDSMTATPVSRTTWGSLKARFR
jgi:hypothetical protein